MKLSAGARDALPDALFDAARGVVRRTPLGGIVSAATLQNALHIGYNRASFMLEALEHCGLLSPPDPYNRRTIVSHQPSK